MSFYKTSHRNGHWPNSGPTRPCLVCGSRKTWCQQSPDGTTALCKNVASGREKVNEQGHTFWVHNLVSFASPRTSREVFPTARPTLASVEARDRGYRAALSRMPLSTAHREQLRRRGLSDEQASRGGYGSLELRGRAAIARAIVDAVGVDEALKIPGVVKLTEAGKEWLSLAGSVGLCIPSRNHRGQIEALKLRRDDPSGAKYVYLSSAFQGGPSASPSVHVSMFGDRAPTVLTEGPLKADVAAALGGFRALSIPGVSMWRLALPVIEELQVNAVAIALDADARRNVAVAQAQLALLKALREQGVRASLWTWDEQHKGIDDLLLSRREAQYGT